MSGYGQFAAALVVWPNWTFSMRPSNPLFLASMLLCFLHPRLAVAQAPTMLAAEVYLGLSITGAVGSVYAIQATPDLAQSNYWTCVSLLQLSNTNYLWLDNSRPSTNARFYRTILVAPTNLVFIPPGTFRMGSSSNEVGQDGIVLEQPQTEVTLTKGFFIGQFEVTQSEFVAVTGKNPSHLMGPVMERTLFVPWSK